MPSTFPDPPADRYCHTCSHLVLAHGAHGCHGCDCAIYIDPSSPRAALRAAAADLGWSLVERETVDEFRRGPDHVTVVYSGHDRPLLATTPTDFGVAGRAATVALDRLLTEPAPVGRCA